MQCDGRLRLPKFNCSDEKSHFSKSIAIYKKTELGLVATIEHEIITNFDYKRIHSNTVAYFIEKGWNAKEQKGGAAGSSNAPLMDI